jgi:sarcosine oxidase subunit gamma
MSDTSLDAARPAALRDTAPWLQPVTPAARFVLQGVPAALAAAAAALGIPDADAPGCTRGDGTTLTLLWLGPDERLLIAWREDAAALGARLEAALAGQPHSLVDVTRRQVGLRLAAPFAADLLNCGCPLDLDPAHFPVGSGTRTLFNKADIVLWRRGVDDFHIEVWRSFEDYLVRWMAEAARDLIPQR